MIIMNPDLYACLPPDKKEEYKKLFPEPVVDPIILQNIRIDDSVPCGYAFLGDQVIKLPEAQTCAVRYDDPMSLKELEEFHKDLNKDIVERDIGNGIKFTYSRFQFTGVKFPDSKNDVIM